MTELWITVDGYEIPWYIGTCSTFFPYTWTLEAQMDTKGQPNSCKGFVARFLARGAVGVSVGLAAVAVASAEKSSNEASDQRGSPGLFSDRLSAVRSAVSEHLNDQLTVAQVVVPRPPPPPPFRNFFGKAPFQDAFRNVPPPPPRI